MRFLGPTQPDSFWVEGLVFRAYSDNKHSLYYTPLEKLKTFFYDFHFWRLSYCNDAIVPLFTKYNEHRLSF